MKFVICDTFINAINKKSESTVIGEKQWLTAPHGQIRFAFLT